MIYNYNELKLLLGSAYRIKRELKNGTLIKISDGVYTDSSNYSPIEYIAKRYPHTVFTFLSALYYRGLVNKPPKYFYVASKKETTRISNPAIKQTFIDNPFEGVDLLTFNGIEIRVFCLERTLISLIKNKNKIDQSTYHQAIKNFRLIEDKIDKIKLKKFISKEKKRDIIAKTIYLEVF